MTPELRPPSRPPKSTTSAPLSPKPIRVDENKVHTPIQPSTLGSGSGGSTGSSGGSTGSTGGSSESTSSVSEQALNLDQSAEEQLAENRGQPIPPPSEPLQYRAIGLVEGRYAPSDEQFTRGTLKASDGTELDAVLLGRVMNLARKHVKPDQDYLWVVYPRTREAEQTLHVQVVGIWAPEEMGQPLPTRPSPQTKPNYFSIRGEVIFQSHDKGFVIVKIQQVAKKTDNNRPQSFKLRLEGSLPSKGVGDFWNLEVSRHGSQLQIESGTDIAPLPRSVPRPRRRMEGSKPSRPVKHGSRPGVGAFSRDSAPRHHESPPERIEKPMKPIKKNKSPES